MYSLLSAMPTSFVPWDTAALTGWFAQVRSLVGVLVTFGFGLLFLVMAVPVVIRIVRKFFG